MALAMTITGGNTTLDEVPFSLSLNLEVGSALPSATIHASTDALAFISTDKQIYSLGEDISVNFENPNARVKEWIGMYPAGKERKDSVSWDAIEWEYACSTVGCNEAATKGFISFSNPGPGEFKVYLLGNEGPPYLIIAVSADFIVHASTEAFSTQPLASISTEREKYLTEENILIDFWNTRAKLDDWIGLYPAGQEYYGFVPSDVLDWIPACDLDTCNEAPKTGRVSLGILPPGEYQVFLLPNQANPPYPVIASSSKFIVSGPEIEEKEEINLTEVLIWTDKMEYLSTDRIFVEFVNPGASYGDWIGLYPAGYENKGFFPWDVLDWIPACDPGACDEVPKEGNVTFGSLPPGSYQLFLLPDQADSPYPVIASSSVFTVSAPAVTVGQQDTSPEILIWTDKGEYSTKDKVVVGFVNANARFDDWIGLYPAEQESNGFVLWDGLDWIPACGTSICHEPRRSGSIMFGNLAPGSYQIFLLPNQAGPPYHVLSSSDVFVVHEKTNVSASPQVPFLDGALTAETFKEINVPTDVASTLPTSEPDESTGLSTEIRPSGPSVQRETNEPTIPNKSLPPQTVSSSLQQERGSPPILSLQDSDLPPSSAPTLTHFLPTGSLSISRPSLPKSLHPEKHYPAKFYTFSTVTAVPTSALVETSSGIVTSFATSGTYTPTASPILVFADTLTAASTHAPTDTPTADPTVIPTYASTTYPTAVLTNAPSLDPTAISSEASQTFSPSKIPTDIPTRIPVASSIYLTKPSGSSPVQSSKIPSPTSQTLSRDVNEIKGEGADWADVTEEEQSHLPATISAAKSRYYTSDAVTLSFTNTKASADDWVGLYPIEIIENGYFPFDVWYWAYACGTQYCNEAQPEGAVTFRDLVPSKYRAFLLSGAPPDYPVIASSNSFDVLDSSPETPAASHSNQTSEGSESDTSETKKSVSKKSSAIAEEEMSVSLLSPSSQPSFRPTPLNLEPASITVDRIEYNTDESIILAFHNPNPYPDDWIGIFPIGAERQGYVPWDVWSWAYACGTQDGCDDKVYSGALSMGTLWPGTYEAFLLSSQGPPYPIIASSQAFVILQSTSAPSSDPTIAPTDSSTLPTLNDIVLSSSIASSSHQPSIKSVTSIGPTLSARASRFSDLEFSLPYNSSLLPLKSFLRFCPEAFLWDGYNQLSDALVEEEVYFSYKIEAISNPKKVIKVLEGHVLSVVASEVLTCFPGKTALKPAGWGNGSTRGALAVNYYPKEPWSSIRFCSSTHSNATLCFSVRSSFTLVTSDAPSARLARLRALAELKSTFNSQVLTEPTILGLLHTEYNGPDAIDISSRPDDAYAVLSETTEGGAETFNTGIILAIAGASAVLMATLIKVGMACKACAQRRQRDREECQLIDNEPAALVPSGSKDDKESTKGLAGENDEEGDGRERRTRSEGDGCVPFRSRPCRHRRYGHTENGGSLCDICQFIAERSTARQNRNRVRPSRRFTDEDRNDDEWEQQRTDNTESALIAQDSDDSVDDDNNVWTSRKEESMYLRESYSILRSSLETCEERQSVGSYSGRMRTVLRKKHHFAE